MSPITTHILDTSTGKPAAGVSVVLELKDESTGWRTIAEGTTNIDGRISDLLSDGEAFAAGDYRLTFETDTYYQDHNVDCFFPDVTISFVIKDPHQHYHVPLLLSPFGYSTYRGS
jgi:5-hydroxyisourate hydrolase